MKSRNILSVIPFIVAFVDYDLFTLIAVIYIIFIAKSSKITTLSKNTSLRFVILFYLARFLSGLFKKFELLWTNLSQLNYSLKGRFIDLQGIFWALNCNSGDTNNLEIYGSNQVLECPYSVSYGPLTEIIYFQNNVYLPTFITAAISISLLVFIFKSSINNLNDEDSYITALIFISPPINFLTERLNFDFLILIFLYFSLKKVKNNFVYNFIIFVLSLIKYYPIVIIFGNLIRNLVKRNYKESITNFLFLTIFTFIYYVENIINIKEFKPVMPFRPDRTFGILSESYNFENIFNLPWQYFYIFLSLIILFFALNLLKKNNLNIFICSNYDFDLAFLFVGISLLANYDYRASFLILLSGNFIKNKNSIAFYSFIIFIFSSPGLLHSYGSLFKLVENYNFFYIDFSFLFLISLFLVNLYNYLNNLNVNISST